MNFSNVSNYEYLFQVQTKMLKWTVSNKRETPGEATAPRRLASSNCSTQRRSIDTIRERKQRRRNERRASLCLRFDKENQFSTPTSNSKLTDILYPTSDSKALRDVSNITPKTHLVGSDITKRNIYGNKETAPTSNLTLQKTVIRPKKKQCLNPCHVKKYSEIHEATRILLNEDNINGHKCISCEILPNTEHETETTDASKNIIRTNFASTLSPLQMENSPCVMRNPCSLAINNNCVLKPTSPYKNLITLPQFKLPVLSDSCPPNKKLKIDHVNDFLHQISFITSPEDFRIRNMNLADRHGNKYTEVNVSPLLRKISDIRFSNTSYSREEKVSTSNSDDSALFNDMSLDKIVDAILDTTIGSEQIELRDTHKKSNELLQCENEQNHASEENQINCEQERYSGIKETFSSGREVGQLENYLDKYAELTNINIDEDASKRKRTFSCTKEYVENRNVEFNKNDSSFVLKRQRCIRRRRTLAVPIKNNLTQESYLEDLKNTPTYTKEINQNNNETKRSILYKETSISYKDVYNDNSFNSSCLSGKNSASLKDNSDHCNSGSSQRLDSLAYSSWKNDMCCGLNTPFVERFPNDTVTERKHMLRSLSSPITVAASSTPTRSQHSVNSSVDLKMFYKSGKLTVHGKSSIFIPHMTVLLKFTACYGSCPILHAMFLY